MSDAFERPLAATSAAETPLGEVDVDADLRHPALSSELERHVETHYLESRLGAGDRQIDHLVALPRRVAATVLPLLASSQPRHSLGQGLPWLPVARLFERWSNTETWLSKHVPTVWLEFDDILGPRAHGATPSVSVCMVANYRCDRPLPARQAEREQRLVSEVLDALALQPNAEQTDTLSAYLLEDTGARWIHLSVMLGREVPAIKLYGSVRRQHLAACLRQLGFAGDAAALGEFMDASYPSDLLGDAVFIDVDIDALRDAERCSLGLAVGQQHLGQKNGTPRFPAQLLDRWCRAGLCSPAKRAGLEAWASSARAGGEAVPHPGRFLDLKLVWRTRSAPIAKAYRGFYGPRKAALGERAAPRASHEPLTEPSRRGAPAP
jgi:hypothetical protein